MDTEAAAKVLIMDWNSGKIPYYTIPPELDQVHVGAQYSSPPLHSFISSSSPSSLLVTFSFG